MNVLVHPLVRRVAKDTAAAVVHYSGLRQAMARYRRLRVGGRRVLILSYHRVVDDFEGERKRCIPGLLISRETFRRHLEEARRAGYELASLEDALEVLAGRRSAARDLCVITFDDGYRDVYRHAFPILKELGVPATVYLPAAFIGTDQRFNHDRLFHLARMALGQRKRPGVRLLEPVAAGRTTLSAALDDYLGDHRTQELLSLIGTLEEAVKGPLQPESGDVMSWDEVREMHRAGVAFGAHTLGHCVLTTEPLEVVEREVRGSKEWIERELGSKVRDFAYCNGWYSDVVVQVLARCGFRSAVTTEDYPNAIGGDPFALKRKVLHENFSVGLDGGYSAPLTACHLDDVFGVLGMSHPVPGRRPHSAPPPEGAAR